MILAVDAHNHLHADWHGAKANAADIFTRRVYDMVVKFRPDKIVIAFDNSEPTFRDEIFPEYKAGRKPTEQGCLDQIERAKDALHKPFECISVAGFEADDIIATVTDQRGDKVVISSTDKDLRQLLCDGEVTILRKWKNGAPEWYTAKRLFGEYGLTPEQWIDWLCIVGDASDNVAGVDGIGEKGATELLKNGTRLTDIMSSPFSHRLTPKKQAAIEAFADRYELVRTLLTLRTDVQIY